MMASVFRTHPALAFSLLALLAAGQPFDRGRSRSPSPADGPPLNRQGRDQDDADRGQERCAPTAGRPVNLHFRRCRPHGLIQPVPEPAAGFHRLVSLLANEDMGVGFDGGPFHYWYAGNAIRVVVNGEISCGSGPRS